jgi:hypothetical protein
MRKPRITRTWLGGLVAIGVGVLVLLAGLGLMLGLGGTWRGSSNNVTFTPKYNSFFWGTVTMMATGGAVLSGGVITQCVAWIGALMNTFRAQDKTWFAALLALGLVGFQFPAMIAYLLAGPDLPSRSLAWSASSAPPLPPPPPPPPVIHRQSV